MSERRYGILIGSSHFPNETGFEDLRCPGNDVDGLEEILSSERYGAFTEIAILKNEPSYHVRTKINQILRQAGKDDMVLIYYSGHGKLNQAGKLCLATTDTVLDSLESTSIRVEEIRDYLEVSSSRKIIMMLDCCFSGAAGAAFSRSGIDDQLQLAASGRGVYIMTASTGIQIAVEKETDRYGAFTKHVIDGIKSGKADLDEDGLVSVDELYEYVDGRVRDEGFQRPMKWDIDVQGRMVISRSTKAVSEERKRQIREMLLDLAGKDILPDRILTQAMELMGKKPEEFSNKQRQYNELLQHLADERIGVRSFIDRWYEVIHSETVPPIPSSVPAPKPIQPKPPPKPAPPEPRPEDKVPESPDIPVDRSIPEDVAGRLKRQAIVLVILSVIGMAAYKIVMYSTISHLVFSLGFLILWAVISVFSVFFTRLARSQRVFVAFALPLPAWGYTLYAFLQFMAFGESVAYLNLLVGSFISVSAMLLTAVFLGFSLLETLRDIKRPVMGGVTAPAKETAWLLIAAAIFMFVLTSLAILSLIDMEEEFTDLIWIPVAVTGVIIGIVAMRKRIWPAAILGWVSALGAIPYLPNGPFYADWPVPKPWTVLYVLAMIYLIIHSTVAIRRRMKATAQPPATAG